MKEIFKTIKGYAGIYEISNLGRVKSLSRQRSESQPWDIKEKLLKPAVNTSGYKFCILTKNKIHKAYLIHRLMGIAFIANPENKLFINHKNAIRTDNNINNIEWCTAKENIHHAVINNLMDWSKACKGELNGRHKLTVNKVKEIKNKFTIGMSDYELAREYSVHAATIWQIRVGNNWVGV